MPAKKKTSSNKVKTKAKATEGNPTKKVIPEAAPKHSDAELRALAHKPKHTPAVFKLPVKKSTPVVFTLEDVRELLKNRKPEVEVKKVPVTPKKTVISEPVQEVVATKRVLGAASLSDILGFGAPTSSSKTTPDPVKPQEVPAKYQRYYDLLIELRNHVKNEINLHSQDTLKKSAKDDSGDLSSFSSHMADNGTDAFDRDFALSLVSNEQEALKEINAAIERIYNGTYGICEITGKEIDPERLEAVPFTKYSLQGQTEFEKQNRKKIQRGAAFMDASSEDTSAYTPDDIEE